MSKILKGPVSLAEVVSLIENTKNTFYANEGYVGKIETKFSQPEEIVLRECHSYGGFFSGRSYVFLPHIENAEISGLYSKLNATTIELLKRNAREFKAEITLKREGESKVRTEIYNKTLLEDTLSGQTFPALNRTYIISTINSEWSLFSKFIEHRNRMIDQAQERLNEYMNRPPTGILGNIR